MKSQLVTTLYSSPGESAHIPKDARIAVLGPGVQNLGQADGRNIAGPMDANVIFLAQWLDPSADLHILDLPREARKKVPPGACTAGCYNLPEVAAGMELLEQAGAAFCPTSYFEGSFTDDSGYRHIQGPSSTPGQYDVLVDHGTSQWILHYSRRDFGAIVGGLDRLLAPNGKALLYECEKGPSTVAEGEMKELMAGLESALGASGYRCTSYEGVVEAYRIEDRAVASALRTFELQRAESRRSGDRLETLFQDGLLFPTYPAHRLVIAQRDAG
jgi:hypothetical protein